jgi:hypothetical protein
MADSGSILVTGAAGQLGAVGRTVTGLRPSFVWSGLLITRLAAPPITARNERLQ